jgi:uncharacterized protein YjiS (DUF1127 family)
MLRCIPAFLLTKLSETVALVRIWRRRSKTRALLRAMDAHALRDIGCTESERQRECARWFWQPYSTSSTFTGSVPNARCASTDCMNWSRSPSSTPPVSEVDTPVRRSFTI